MAVVTDREQKSEAFDRTKPMILVSNDTHVGPRVEEDLRPYCPPRYLEQYNEFAKQVEIGREMLAAFVATQQGEMRTANLLIEGHYDGAARLRDLDHDGVAAAVIYHGSQNPEPIPFVSGGLEGLSGGSGPAPDYELLGVGLHIYNEWLVDICSVEPERQIGAVQLPMWDIPAAIKELEWARSAGLRCINFPSKPNMPYNHPDWDPFWSAAEDLNMPLCSHGGAGTGIAMDLPGAMMINIVRQGYASRLMPMDTMILGGVFERHPKLKVISAEIVGVWWPHVLAELDSIWFTYTQRFKNAEMRASVPRRPSEYAAEHIYQGATFQSRAEAKDAIEKGYVDRVVWGSDYPHMEGTHQAPEGNIGKDEPMNWSALRFTYAGLPPEDVSAMVGGNAIEAYGLDEKALEKVAARINAPTFNDIDRPLDKEPEGAGFFSFRTIGEWG